MTRVIFKNANVMVVGVHGNKPGEDVLEVHFKTAGGFRFRHHATKEQVKALVTYQTSLEKKTGALVANAGAC